MESKMCWGDVKFGTVYKLTNIKAIVDESDPRPFTAHTVDLTDENMAACVKNDEYLQGLFDSGKLEQAYYRSLLFDFADITYDIEEISYYQNAYKDIAPLVPTVYIEQDWHAEFSGLDLPLTDGQVTFELPDEWYMFVDNNIVTVLEYASSMMKRKEYKDLHDQIIYEHMLTAMPVKCIINK